jgi:hypothetical protein
VPVGVQVAIAAAEETRGSDRMIQERPVTLDQLQSFALQGTLYALLDACDEPTVPKRCAELGESRAVSLYRGEKATEFAHLAPYLAQLDKRDVEWIQKKLWASPWGYFVLARSDLATLRSHFRRYLTVKLPDGSKVLFRFYDPRVIRTYLGASDLATTRQFFGPVQGLGLSGAGLADVTLLTPSQ